MQTTNNSGFTLIEIIFAIVLLSSIAAPILMLNYNVLISTGRTSELAEHSILLDRVLNEQEQQYVQHEKEKNTGPIKTTIKIDEPPATITYERKPIPQQSQLSAFKELQLVKASTTWQLRSGGTRTESVVTFAIKPIAPVAGDKK